MKGTKTLVAAILMSISFHAVAVGQSSDYKRRARQMKAEHQRRVAKMKFEHDRRVAKMKSDFEQRQRVGQDGGMGYRQNVLVSQDHSSSFDPAEAPSPEICLEAYIAAIGTAEKLEDIYNYIPRTQRPAVDRSDSSTVWQNSGDEIDEDELAHRKRLANSILKVLSVKSNGNEATVMVATKSMTIADPQARSYGKARIEMVGENKYWKIRRFRNTLLKYSEPPQE